MSDLNRKYRQWKEWPDCVTSVKNIDKGSRSIHFYREKDSFRGISEYTGIGNLFAKQVNQDFLNEIAGLTNLKYLELETVSAQDLSPLLGLRNLETLKINGAHKVKDFACLLDIQPLNRLFIENAKSLKSIEFFSNANNFLALGLEGSMYTKLKIQSLKPLSGLKNLEGLFLTSVQLADKNLDYLASIAKLKYLGCARFAPKQNFESLKALKPTLECSWFNNYEL